MPVFSGFAESLPTTELIAGFLADEIARQGFGVADNFLGAEQVADLQAALHAHLEAGRMKKAGIGQQDQFMIDRQIRGDYIHWIDPQHALPATTFFLGKMNELVGWLNRFLFLSIRDFEAHFAMYPPGAGYQRHLDQFKNDGNRLLSFVFYLNDEWQEEFGGALRMFLTDEQGMEIFQDILPLAGRLVVFRSDLLEHEVRPSFRTRLSLTGWMLNQPQGLEFLR